MAPSTPPSPFVPALIVIDMQNDFCEGGSLAVAGGHALIPTINKLLNLPFALKLATRDWHPSNHLSFASQHVGKAPFDSYSLANTRDPGETKPTTLWPDHCVQESRGAAFAPGLDTARLDAAVLKGTRADVETYSFLADIFGNGAEVGFSEDARQVLREKGVTHAYVVGLAGDFCVRYSALDLRRVLGLETFVLEGGTAWVDPGKGREETEREWSEAGVKVVPRDGAEVGWVEGLEK